MHKAGVVHGGAVCEAAKRWWFRCFFGEFRRSGVGRPVEIHGI